MLNYCLNKNMFWSKASLNNDDEENISEAKYNSILKVFLSNKKQLYDFQLKWFILMSA